MDGKKKGEIAVAVLTRALGNEASNNINRMLDAQYPRIIMTKEGPRVVDSQPKADRQYAERQAQRSMRELHKIGSILLKAGGFTVTGNKPKQRKGK